MLRCNRGYVWMALRHTSDITALFLTGTLGTGALFRVWIMDQSQNQAEGGRENPSPARWGISWGEKQHPATAGERLGSMDLFEVLVHVMVNLVLLKLNRSRLICMEVGVRGLGEWQSYWWPPQVWVCENWPSVVGYYKCLTSPFSPVALLAHPESLFLWGPSRSGPLHTIQQENTFLSWIKRHWGFRFSLTNSN